MHQTLGAFGGDGAGTLAGFLLDDAAKEFGLQLVALGGAIDQGSQFDLRDGVTLGRVHRRATPFDGEFHLLANGGALNFHGGALFLHGRLEGLSGLIGGLIGG